VSFVPAAPLIADRAYRTFANFGEDLAGNKLSEGKTGFTTAP